MPVQHVELVEQKSVRKVTWADINRWSAEEYARKMKDTDIAPQINTLPANED